METRNSKGFSFCVVVLFASYHLHLLHGAVVKYLLVYRLIWLQEEWMLCVKVFVTVFIQCDNCIWVVCIGVVLSFNDVLTFALLVELVTNCCSACASTVLFNWLDFETAVSRFLSALLCILYRGSNYVEIITVTGFFFLFKHLSNSHFHEKPSPLKMMPGWQCNSGQKECCR